jgi:hypothetical protein
VSDTPRTDKLYEEVWRFTNETDAVDALISMRDLCRELERENAALRELTSTLGAPNHINIPVEKWHELRKDKERLEWVIKDSYYHFFFKLSSDLEKGRRQIDAARKEAQP